MPDVFDSHLKPVSEAPLAHDCDSSHAEDGLTPLVELSALYWLSLGGSQVIDLTPLAGLTALQLLRLHGERGWDPTPLDDLVKHHGLLISGPIKRPSP
jgi:hypothetical protein